MKAQDGIMMLVSLFRQPKSEMTVADMEEAIRIAGQYSPSSSYDRATQYWFRMHGQPGIMELAFPKGTRWLAMIRRDEGCEAFDQAAARLREAIR